MINKEDFIQTYTTQFMATFDANHIMHVGGSDQLAYRCTYEHALIHAENAWKRKLDYAEQRGKCDEEGKIIIW